MAVMATVCVCVCVCVRVCARSHPCVVRALCISRSYMENNYIRWFRLVSSLSPLEQSAVLPYVSTMRRYVVIV